MQITLIDPLMDYRAHCVSETLGLMYVAAVLREAGHEVRIVATGLRPTQALLPEDVAHADLVGITATSALFGHAKEVLATIRTWRPELPVVLGGAHATVSTASALEAGFDYAILGEAEITIAKFVENLGHGEPRNTRGIAFLDDTGAVHKTPESPLVEDLDTLPFPARDLYDYDAFKAAGGWEMGIMSSRGCPFRCTFCQPTLNLIFGRMRKRGPENVAAEMAELQETYAPQMLYFKDDTLSANGLEWFSRFQSALNELGVTQRWKCNTRVDKVGPRILDAMAAAGCEEVVFGVESGSQRILDFYQKDIVVEDTIRAFALCKERGIHAGANVILGAPMETPEEMEQTYQLLTQIKPDHFWVFFATALPGKALTQYVVEHNLLKRNLGYHYYDTAMNGVFGTANIALESITFEQMVSMRNRILGLKPGASQEELAIHHQIPQHTPQRAPRG
jgi:radical SAM superfamily enzyme YgiQ (UPF0313 family)